MSSDERITALEHEVASLRRVVQEIVEKVGIKPVLRPRGSVEDYRITILGEAPKTKDK